jgi:hypothetical protein
MFAVLPSLVPLALLQHDYALATRLSNLVSCIVRFTSGYQWGRHTGSNPWKSGLVLVAVGLVLVAIALLMGG